MNEHLIRFLVTLSLGVNLFALFHLVRSKSLKLLSNKVATAIIILWILRFGLLYVKFEDFALQYPILLVSDQSLFLLDGLLAWLYSRSLLLKKGLSAWILIHFIPFILLILLNIGNVIFYPEEVVIAFQDAIAAFENNKPTISGGVVIFIAVLIGLNAFYLVKGINQVRKYNYNLFDYFSNVEDKKVSWIITFQWLWIGFFFLPLFLYFVNYIFPVFDAEILGILLITSLTLLSIFFNTNVLQQDAILMSESSFVERSKEESKVTFKDQQKIGTLKKLLETEKYYQDENLSLNQLATYMQIKPVELTQLIKKSEYDNFYDMINSYRVKAMKDVLIKSKEQIIILAYQNGFNSKSTFNKIFKEKTGKTPKEYRFSPK